MKMLNLTKSVTEIMVSVGVGSIVGNAIKVGTPAGTHIIKRACIAVGGFVLSSMISDKASKYASEAIDETVDKIKNIIKPNSPDETQVETKLSEETKVEN